MYCSKCGEQIDDEAVICPKCGCATGKQLIEQKQNQFTDGKSKKSIGILMGMFLGLIGLIIGLVIYPSGSKDRETFLEGFWIGFVIEIIASIVLGVIIGIYSVKIIDFYDHFY